MAELTPHWDKFVGRINGEKTEKGTGTRKEGSKMILVREKKKGEIS